MPFGKRIEGAVEANFGQGLKILVDAVTEGAGKSDFGGGSKRFVCVAADAGEPDFSWGPKNKVGADAGGLDFGFESKRPAGAAEEGVLELNFCCSPEPLVGLVADGAGTTKSLAEAFAGGAEPKRPVWAMTEGAVGMNFGEEPKLPVVAFADGAGDPETGGADMLAGDF